MTSLKKIICLLTLTLLLSLSLTPTRAQQAGQASGATEVEMADTFRQEGKIYVVVAVMLILLGGLSWYAFTIDRKISRLEKEHGL